MKRTGWLDNNIEDFIEQYGINEEMTDKEIYDHYKNVTEEPYSKTMFTQYLKNQKGYTRVRKSILGVRHYFYEKIR